MRIRFFVSQLVLVSLLASCSTARAAIIVSFGGPVNVAAGGGTASIDVFVSSSTGTDNLDLFGAEFLLAPVGLSPVGGLQFGTQLEGQLSDGTYVHAGNSAGSPIGNVSGTNNETYIGGDSTADFAGTFLPLDPLNHLLFRLDLATTTALAGDQYQLTLVNDGNTFFLDENFSDLSIDGSSFSNFGTINITAATAAVPEPGSMVLCLSGLAAGIVMYRRRHKSLRIPRCPAYSGPYVP